MLVNQYSLQSPSAPVHPLVSLDPEEKMYKMIGTYWGRPEKEDKYSLSFFDSTYWSV
jgi:hypothetical protein